MEVETVATTGIGWYCSGPIMTRAQSKSCAGAIKAFEFNLLPIRGLFSPNPQKIFKFLFQIQVRRLSAQQTSLLFLMPIEWAKVCATSKIFLGRAGPVSKENVLRLGSSEGTLPTSLNGHQLGKIDLFDRRKFCLRKIYPKFEPSFERPKGRMGKNVAPSRRSE